MLNQSRLTLPALAAALALGFAPAAMAQTMVGTQSVSDADLPMVTAHCATLLGEETTSSESGAAAEGSDTAPAAGETAPESDTDTAATDEMTEGTPATVDLSAITAEDCRAAGLPNSQ